MAADTKHREPLPASTTTEYCAELQRWMWRSYCGSMSWQNWATLPAAPVPPPAGTQVPTPCSHGDSQPVYYDAWSWYRSPYDFNPPGASSPPEQGSAGRAGPQQDGDSWRAGREYSIPSPLQRFLAETVDFCILFCVKVTIVLWIMHLSGMKDITKFINHFFMVEIDENTTLEDIEKILAVALAYRVLVCVYETLCIWGAGGATPGKFLLGLRVVTYDTSTLVEPNRVLVVPASNVSLSASASRAWKKNLFITFLVPVFITVFFFRHNRTVYDITAGTIVVQCRGGR